ncbi:MAG: acetyl-CoA decarbonylase/synthase complex subunit delta, partial [Methanobacteriota archaeon]
MRVETPVERWTGKIGIVTLGATEEEGGTRGRKVVIGGAATLPFLSFEGETGYPPVIAGEVIDTTRNYPEQLRTYFGDAVEDPGEWAKKWVEKYGADLICLKLHSTNPEEEDKPPEEAIEAVKTVLESVPVPLIVYGCGDHEKDAKTMELVSNVGAGERLLLGHAEEEAYKSIAAAAMANGHAVIAFSNIDINLAKQINILLTDFGVKKEDIVMDPLLGGLGMGIEYSYSMMEWIRLAALMGDTMLQMPMLCDTSIAWKAKECTEEIAEFGDIKKRAVYWEETTAVTALMAGADL